MASTASDENQKVIQLMPRENELMRVQVKSFQTTNEHSKNTTQSV